MSVNLTEMEKYYLNQLVTAPLYRLSEPWDPYSALSMFKWIVGQYGNGANKVLNNLCHALLSSNQVDSALRWQIVHDIWSKQNIGINAPKSYMAPYFRSLKPITKTNEGHVQSDN
jgi:hypothetical protein